MKRFPKTIQNAVLWALIKFTVTSNFNNYVITFPILLSGLDTKRNRIILAEIIVDLTP